MHPPRLLFAPVVLLAIASPASSQDISLAPHRAVYEMGLHRSGGPGSVVAVSGRLVMEFTDTCDGYTLNQRIRTEMTNSDGDTVASDFTISSWERRDGRRFRFALKHDLTGEETEEHVGNAEIVPGKPGKAVLSKPEPSTVNLPAGIVFPTEHLVRLIRAAREGRSHLSTRIFDGSGEDGLFETGAHIGRELADDSAGSELLKPLKGVRSWPVRIAYFPLPEGAETPRYEVQFRMYDNGIGGDLILDYHDFAMKGTMTLLELLPQPKC
ncbi:MAG: cell envelope integrity EipB family protein [Alphaproteobacteria bacterium]|nr:cell envelope integrity EipB family protein [Alphaproteobacteria bacterium]MCW5750471.1 cell envelope integrity EipB family protein [Alphaproteobacteria bacterium]